MAPNDSAQATDEAGEPGAGRRKAARYLVPVAVAGVAAATIGLVPALAASGDPSLPKISAQQLIEKIAASDTQQLSGTVKITTDLGLPGPRQPRLVRAQGRRLRQVRRAAAEAHGARLGHAHPAGRGRRPRPPEGVHPGERGRVQPDPQRQRGLGVRQRLEPGLPLARSPRQARPGSTAGRHRSPAFRPRRRRWPTSPSRPSTPPPRCRSTARPGRRARRVPAAHQAQAVRLDDRLGPDRGRRQDRACR